MRWAAIPYMAPCLVGKDVISLYVTSAILRITPPLIWDTLTPSLLVRMERHFWQGLSTSWWRRSRCSQCSSSRSSSRSDDSFKKLQIFSHQRNTHNTRSVPRLERAQSSNTASLSQQDVCDFAKLCGDNNPIDQSVLLRVRMEVTKAEEKRPGLLLLTCNTAVHVVTLPSSEEEEGDEGGGGGGGHHCGH
jgi:hypothetical protein